MDGISTAFVILSLFVNSPAPELNLKLEAPINTWDEAIPLGNGLLGGLLWGSDHTIRLSLDRGDLWDLRRPEITQRPDWTWTTIQKLVKEKNHSELVRRFDTPYNAVPYPTKIPAGRLEFTLESKRTAQSFSLDLASAEGRVHLSDGKRIDVFYCAERPVAMVRIPGPEPESWRWIPPASVRKLGYADAELGAEGEAKWFVQKAARGLVYVSAAAMRRNAQETLMAVTVASTRDDPDPLALARKRISGALDRGYNTLLRIHESYWKKFWARSHVDLPDRDHLAHYYLVRYFYGAASRSSAPPIPLQGVWTADAGTLPPWKGDYHHDLNTQMTYAAYQTAGHFEEGRCFFEFLWRLLPNFRDFARNFYAAPGAAVPAVMTLDGKPMGGWCMYSLHPTNGAWLGHLFYLHWRYTWNVEFLQERAYPWCSEIGECLLALLKKNADGQLRLPLSSSPEIHNNGLAAWLTPNSNYDRDCMVALFENLSEMAEALDDGEAARKWRRAAKDLGDPAVEADTRYLMLSPDEKLRESHRHFSTTMGIHPFTLMTIDGSEEDRAIIDASMKLYDQLGTGAWCGYSFSWMSCLRARVGQAEQALRYLDIYRAAFILRNGFHVNGDQLRAGYSNFTYRPFTMEGNFLAMQAIHEMLLQSWGGIVRIFPATPWRWHRASFRDLRAEGGFTVSARRENNATVWLSVQADQSRTLRIRDNFGGREPQWNRKGVKVGDNYEFQLKAAEVLEGTLPVPSAIPPPPEDVATPRSL